MKVGAEVTFFTNERTLATRDARAKLTYDAIGVHVEVVA
jgi:hypothetical protein